MPQSSPSKSPQEIAELIRRTALSLLAFLPLFVLSVLSWFIGSFGLAILVWVILIIAGAALTWFFKAGHLIGSIALTIILLITSFLVGYDRFKEERFSFCLAVTVSQLGSEQFLLSDQQSYGLDQCRQNFSLRTYFCNAHQFLVDDPASVSPTTQVVEKCKFGQRLKNFFRY